MTARTIWLVDTYCVAANWQGSIDSLPDNDVLDRKRWTKNRDKAVARLRTVMAGLTDYEKDWVRRKCRGAELAEDFRKLGIEPNWTEQT